MLYRDGYCDIDTGLKETLKCVSKNNIKMDIRLINAILGVLQTRGLIKKHLEFKIPSFRNDVKPKMLYPFVFVNQFY